MLKLKQYRFIQTLFGLALIMFLPATIYSAGNQPVGWIYSYTGNPNDYKISHKGKIATAKEFGQLHAGDIIEVTSPDGILKVQFQNMPAQSLTAANTPFKVEVKGEVPSPINKIVSWLTSIVHDNTTGESAASVQMTSRGDGLHLHAWQSPNLEKNLLAGKFPIGIRSGNGTRPIEITISPYGTQKPLYKTVIEAESIHMTQPIKFTPGDYSVELKDAKGISAQMVFTVHPKDTLKLPPELSGPSQGPVTSLLAALWFMSQQEDERSWSYETYQRLLRQPPNLSTSHLINVLETQGSLPSAEP
jgi:hypothetical protein